MSLCKYPQLQPLGTGRSLVDCQRNSINISTSFRRTKSERIIKHVVNSNSRVASFFKITDSETCQLVTEHVLHEFPIHKKGTVAFKLGKIIEILVKLIKLVLLFIIQY